MKKIIFISCACFFILTGAIFAKNVSVLLKVPGITWPGTAYRVSSTLKGLKGVKIVNTSVRKKEAFVQFDDEKVKLNDILSALKKAGYSAKVEKNVKWNLI